MQTANTSGITAPRSQRDRLPLPSARVNSAACILSWRSFLAFCLLALLANALILSLAAPVSAQGPLWVRRAKIFASSPDMAESLAALGTAKVNGSQQTTDASGSNNVLALSPSFSIATASSWANTANNLSVKRFSHTATRLLNGKVLVAGGEDGSLAGLASAELYDPATGLWTATGSMKGARAAHTATLLPNGRVLVAGGFSRPPLHRVGKAELYNPETGNWTATARLKPARSDHAATVLLDGTVLVAGGAGSQGSSLADAQLYQSAP
jgi:hypothetical protein